LEETKQKKKGIRWLYLLLSIVLWAMVLAWMWVIFALSSETGFASSSRSDVMIRFLDQNFGLEVSVLFIRKAAHFFEYALLTSLAFFAFAATSRVSENNPLVEIPVSEMKSSFQTNAMLSIWITVLYAVLDEYHQIFVLGRKARITDVLIDILGGVFVLVFLRIIVALMLINKKRSECSDL
jgi:VanZ family protein